ncbi:hypothetical protein K9M41_01240 [Candidatus Gracilibacteria bacterium]|nr:hypothetical protein [Candidatus Gracilibacteria bacterium]
MKNLFHQNCPERQRLLFKTRSFDILQVNILEEGKGDEHGGNSTDFPQKISVNGMVITRILPEGRRGDPSVTAEEVAMILEGGSSDNDKSIASLTTEEQIEFFQKSKQEMEEKLVKAQEVISDFQAHCKNEEVDDESKSLILQSKFFGSEKVKVVAKELGIKSSLLSFSGLIDEFKGTISALGKQITSLEEAKNN